MGEPMEREERIRLNKWAGEQAEIIGFNILGCDPIQRPFNAIIENWSLKHDPTGIAGLDAKEPMIVVFLRASKAYDNHKWLINQLNKAKEAM